MEEKIRRALYDIAALLENIAEGDLELLREIEVVAGNACSRSRQRMHKKLKENRDSANHMKKEIHHWVSGDDNDNL